MTNMNINSIKLVNSGLKGIVITYANTSDKGRRTFIDEHVSKKKAPIHEELELAFESLRKHLLEICGYDNNDSQEGVYNVSCTEITKITYNDKGFVIAGKYKILGGDKTISLITPSIKDESEFENFNEVVKTLELIYDEAKSYMSGEKSFSDEQLVLKFSEGKQSFDKVAFKAMNKSQQRDVATKILEDMGSMVFHTATDEEIVAEEVVLEKVVAIVEPVVSDDFELEENKEVAPAKMVVVKNDNKSTLSMVTEGDNFKIISTPMEAKVSTAKKLKVG